MNKEKKTNLVVSIILTGFVAAIFLYYVKGFYYHMPYPHNTFLFLPRDAGNDFFNLISWNKDLNPYFQGVATAQYPLLNLLSYLLGLINKNISFILYNIVVVVAFIRINTRALGGDNAQQLYVKVFIFSLLTYPFLFTVDRGNFEIMLCVFMLLFIYYYQEKKYTASALFLALAVSMKLFPVVMLVMLVSEKKYRTALITVFFTVLLTLLCLSAFKGGLYMNLMAILSGANIQNNSNILSFVGDNNLVQRGVTLFTFFKVLLCQFGIISRIDMVQFLLLYKIIIVIIAFFLSVYVVFVEKELWKKVSILVFIMLLFPQISADYKLMHIYIPLLLFINAAIDKKYDLFYTIMFSLLLIPKDYFLLYSVSSDSGTNDIGIGVLLNPIIMISMMAVIIVTGMKNISRSTIHNSFQEHLNAIRLFKN